MMALTVSKCFNWMLWWAVVVFFPEIMTNGLDDHVNRGCNLSTAISGETPLSAAPTASKGMHPNGHHVHSSNVRMDFGGAFTSLDKEVVEQLTKQWAPVVWLAPEEQFMPLGVEEFLNNVHPTMDKGTSFMSTIPVGENSKRVYLVTKAEIDKLLEDKNSFIYGQNPNKTPVPIYAVIKLCGQDFSHLSKMNDGMAKPLTPPQLSQLAGGVGPTAFYEMTASGKRKLPYIPVSLDRNVTFSDSSYVHSGPNGINHSDLASAYYGNKSQSFLPQFEPSSHNFVENESQKDESAMNQLLAGSTSSRTDEMQVNNFMANLAHNVKFSWATSGEQPNDIEMTGNFYKQSSQRSANNRRQKAPSFYVTYWMFYPYSQGKNVCTLNLGPLGHIPFPSVYGYCLGKRKDIGSHIGDWEHMSLLFSGDTEPNAMYVSAHDAGAFYIYNQLTGSFEFKNQETRKGILQRPNFPKTVTTFNDHPVLFAAKGSHGLWTAPGKHNFVKVARLYDINGFGTPWNTWKTVHISYKNLKTYEYSMLPTWLKFNGKWGNPKSKCHPFRRIGLNFCEFTDGPTGIPQKEPHFQCGTEYRRS